MLTLQQLPFVIDSEVLRSLPCLDSDSDYGTSPPSHAPTQTGASSQSSTATFPAAGTAANVELTSSPSNDSAVVSLLDKYGPIVIALFAGNIVIMTLLCVIAHAACMRGAIRGGARARNSSPSYAPVAFKDRAANEDPEFTASSHNYGR
ncbi:hypothetical protein PHLGIDRAFT_414342 [Phlebiopsis gigantea 11061_1 CR5-6]|uniref:Uncharacterized protein n=1 Tax=Phlebiopsis gigantea (strain 11061_1 CR5-6) TaxID=745531 RepID=A0A0C3RZ36_PHLG1|nr:hypothetical protein PHLGIDRAFT_414342 [Phlebiopsis gigantea 11061_1 CR5-6]